MVRNRSPGPRGRGAASNPASRFPRIEVISEGLPPNRIPTQFLRDDSRTVITRNESPDVPFEVSVNPFRGCEHGCIYCYARPYHEYLGFSAGLDFETRILVKQDAAELLERELASTGWRPRVLALSGVTDPYQPVERKLRVTRRCLEVLSAFRNPVSLITKNALVTRDLDLLAELARHRAVSVMLSLTTLDSQLAARLEPRTSRPSDRLRAVRRLTEHGIPCGVAIAPVIPALTDHEIPSLLEAAADHGAGWANWLLLRLPGAVEALFLDWMARHCPDRRAKILSRLRSLRAGRLSDSRFGSRMRGNGVFSDQIRSLFRTACSRHGLDTEGPQLSTAAFRRPYAGQLALFGD